MSNSPLVTYTKLSPNCNKPRNHAIDTITIHCVVGHCSAQTIGDIFYPSSRQASSNYGVDDNGGIGLYVNECDRSWCTSSASNDHRAITIEVASDLAEPYAFTDKAYATLLTLVTDICKRNNIKQLLWKADKSLVGQPDKQNLTVHRWFANKSCPGNFMYNKMGEFAAEVNKRLGGAAVEPATPTPATPVPSTPATTGSFNVGDIVDFTGTVHRTSANATSGVACKPGKAKITQIYPSGKYPYHLVAEKGGGSTVYGWVATGDIKGAGSTPDAFHPYVVRVTADSLNYRKGPGTNYAINGAIKDKGSYTIIEESAGAGATKWGRLKSGVGWISLDYTQKV